MCYFGKPLPPDELADLLRTGLNSVYKWGPRRIP